MRVLDRCKPEKVFYYFEEICRIPHASGDLEQIAAYLVGFAKEQGLDYVIDDAGNVLIRKPAASGREDSETVILQGHMDMVAEKTKDSTHDFSKDPLALMIDGDEIYAKDTTLGGDDGIAVAYMLAILADDSISTPALECLFTVDEEIGLLGARAFDTTLLSGKTLINLDSEEEGILWVSCAGGLCAQSELPLTRVAMEGLPVEIVIDGLLGGHSGGEIDKGRANANILLGRLLQELGEELPYGICAAAGGTKDNAITRRASVSVLINEDSRETLSAFIKKLQDNLRKEYAGIDEGITITQTFGEVTTCRILDPRSREKVVFFLRQMPFGVQKMSGVIKGLVETSLNLGILELLAEEDYLFTVTSVRSSVASAKYALCDKIRYLTEFLGGEFAVSGDYPAWEYREDSPLREKMKEIFAEMYGSEPRVLAIHAGLECGLFYDKITDLDCVSIGPDMSDIHTSEERLSISSTERVYRYLLRVLQVL